MAGRYNEYSQLAYGHIHIRHNERLCIGLGATSLQKTLYCKKRWAFTALKLKNHG